MTASPPTPHSLLYPETLRGTASESTEAIRTVDYTSAADIVADLADPTWRKNGWLFRGQREDWALLPSACRRPNTDTADLPGLPDPAGRRRLAEAQRVINFACTADEQGLPVPGYTDEWAQNPGRELIDGMIEHECNVGSTDGMFPPRKWRSMFAMAQHYGITTRLLDWTADPLAALYFAIVEWVRSRPNDPSNRFVVWALSPVLAQTSGMRIVRAPSHSNPNLRAQRARFTLHQVGYVGEFSPLEETLERIFQSYRTIAQEVVSLATLTRSPLAFKLRAPCLEAAHVWDRLLGLGFAPAALFPGYSGVVQYLQDAELRKKWNSTD